MKTAASILALLVTVTRFVTAAPATVPADADTTLREDVPNANLGAGTSLQAGRIDTTGNRARALLSFNVAAVVPPGATITRARLALSAIDAPPLPQSAQAFEIRRVLRPWSEEAQAGAQGGTASTNDATWSHRFYPNTGWAGPGGAIGSDFAAATSGEFLVADAGRYTIDSTQQMVADVQTWLDNPERNYGWGLLGKVESVPQTLRTFAAREDSARAPALEIEFTVATPGNATTAEYDVVFNATWSSTSHPTDFPAGAHWSGLVGGSHDNRVEFWHPGRTSSTGIQNVAELGSKTALLSEVNTAIAAGTANRTLSGAGISGGAGTATLRFQIDRTHPLVTLVSMIAPSPDWFAGVRGLPLIENGRWVQSKTVALVPWDTGTDSGATFTSPDSVTTPRGVLTRIVTPPLATNGVAPPMGTFTFTLVRTIPGPTYGNISTRLPVGTGENVGIGGFIVSGPSPKKVIIRAIGPTLPVPGALADPVLELHKPDGSVLSNDDWRKTQQDEIIASGIPPANNLESAIVATLDAGAYTEIVRGKDGGTGIGLVEVYDLDPTADSKLANISTRGFVGAGENVMIGGTIVVGSSPATTLVRAIGASLTKASIVDALPDPILELHDGQGTLIASNDNWKDSQQADITPTSLTPSDDRESAILRSLAPGAYTAIVRGKNGLTGIALVEAYQLQ
ncbi:MAG: spondin domain-containing protein [Chthoniobacterales bacterium]